MFGHPFPVPLITYLFLVPAAHNRPDAKEGEGGRGLKYGEGGIELHRKIAHLWLVGNEGGGDIPLISSAGVQKEAN